MVTKRKPPKQNSEQGAPAKPARPSVKGKTVARGQVRPDGGANGKEQPQVAQGIAGASDAARKMTGANASAMQRAAGDAASQPAKSGKPKRRIAMPQSSSRLKQNQTANNAANVADARVPAAGDSEDAASSKAAARSAKPTKARTPLAGSSVAAAQTRGQQAAESAPGAASSAGGDAGSQGSATRPKARRPKRFSVAKAEKAAADQAKTLEGKVSASDAASAEDAARASLAADAAKRRLERRQRMLAHQGESGEGAAASSDDAGKPANRRMALPHIGGKRGGVGEGVDLAAAETDAAQGTSGTGDAAPRKRKAPAFHITWPVGLALAVLAIVVVAVSVFSWGRWLRYDDAADFQGMWYANGTTSIVTVDGEKIHLTDDVAYNYTLDTGAKTITFTFGQMEGHGRYRFSVDRSELVITDGNDFSFWGNLFDDIGWQLDQAIRNMQGQEIEREAVVDGVTVLDRTQTQGATAAAGAQSAGAASASDGPADTEADGANASDDAEADAVDDATSENSADVSAGGSADSAANGSQAANDSSDSSFQGAVAEGGIDSAGSNAVTLEQLKSGSL